jgi:hypothetical protein
MFKTKSARCKLLHCEPLHITFERGHPEAVIEPERLH